MTVQIEIKPIGNIGNRMIQYLAAWKLVTTSNNATILTPNLPEWGFVAPRVERFSEARELFIEADNPISFSTLHSMIISNRIERIVIADHMQRMDCIPNAQSGNSLFPRTGGAYKPDSDELVINIRAAELVAGIGHYPLVPIDFYEAVIELTGRKPVFMGQLGRNEYCDQLRRRFPKANFLESQGVLRDFETIRLSKHVIPSVSTFSWLAAYLSEAELIYLPVLGFYNPAHFGRKRIIDLLPTNDLRYRFYLFPLHYGVPEAQDLPYHRALFEQAREVSPRQLDVLRTRPPAIDVATVDIDFDAVWYTNSNLSVGVDISQGWVAGPLEHYLEIGMRRGYQAVPSGFSQRLATIDSSLSDMALNKPASQSSISEWSIAATTEQEAARAVSGPNHHPFAFHTSHEENPWWQVDLSDIASVKHIVVFNRNETPVIAGRSTPLVASSSLDGEMWTELFITPDSFIFGIDGKPLIWTARGEVRARFIKLTVPRNTFLHLRKVQIFGMMA